MENDSDDKKESAQRQLDKQARHAMMYGAGTGRITYHAVDVGAKAPQMRQVLTGYFQSGDEWEKVNERARIADMSREEMYRLLEPITDPSLRNHLSRYFKAMAQREFERYRSYDEREQAGLIHEIRMAFVEQCSEHAKIQRKKEARDQWRKLRREAWGERHKR